MDSAATTVYMISCPYTTDTLLATSAISVIVTALLAIVIFVLVQVALCRWYPMKLANVGGAQLAHRGEEQEYVKVG